MKFNSILVLSTLAVLAAADGSSSSSTTSATSTTATLSPQASCAAAKCTSSETCCIAQCYGVPCPDQTHANETNQCVANCHQGNGTAAETEAYIQCQQACFSSLFFPATITSSGSSATGSSSNRASTTGSSSGSSATGSSGTSTATGTQASKTANAAATSQLQLGVSAAGLLGVVLAAWAL